MARDGLAGRIAAAAAFLIGGRIGPAAAVEPAREGGTMAAAARPGWGVNASTGAGSDRDAANQAMDHSSQMRPPQQDQAAPTNRPQMTIGRRQAATPAPDTGPNASGGGTGIGH